MSASSWSPGQPWPDGWKEQPAERSGNAVLVWVGRGRGRWKNRYRVHFRTDDGRTGSASLGLWRKGDRSKWVWYPPGTPA